ncbi:MAG: endonuclease domain-containing protein, partial [Rhodoplanes sp.]
MAPKAPGWGQAELPDSCRTPQSIKERGGQAQSLRRRPTDAEARLWRILRSLKPLGLHFRRQSPIGPYIVDFAWL